VQGAVPLMQDGTPSGSPEILIQRSILHGFRENVEISSSPARSAILRATLSGRTSGCPTLKLRVPLKPVPFGLKRKEFYATTEVARVVGISPDLFRW
jgi:hypothetical protein